MQSDELTLAGGHVEDGREIVTLARWAVALGSRLFLVLVQSQVRVDLAVFHARLRKAEVLEEDVCATLSYIIPVIPMSHIHVERQFALSNVQVPLENSYMHTPIRAYLSARISTAFSQKIPNHAEDRALNLHFGSPNPPSRKQKSAADHTHDAEVLISHSSM